VVSANLKVTEPVEGFSDRSEHNGPPESGRSRYRFWRAVCHLLDHTEGSMDFLGPIVKVFSLEWALDFTHFDRRSQDIYYNIPFLDS